MIFVTEGDSVAGQHVVDGTTLSTEVAITIDDIPGTPSRTVDGPAVASAILAAFKKHHLTGVYGMMVGSFVQSTPTSRQVLRQWVDSGQLLANHTWSHLDLVKVSADDFIADVRQNESLLATLMGQREWRYLRFPYLAEGDNEEKRRAVRDYLASHNYQTAQVTFDFFDYEWIDPYNRCLSKGRVTDAAWLRHSYVQNALYGLKIAQRLSLAVIGRQIKQVLLVHFGRIQADVMDESLTALEQQGVHFIDLRDALSDLVYSIDTRIVSQRSYTFLNQLRLQKGMDNPARVQELYDLLPEARLASICN